MGGKRIGRMIIVKSWDAFLYNKSSVKIDEYQNEWYNFYDHKFDEKHFIKFMEDDDYIFYKKDKNYYVLWKVPKIVCKITNIKKENPLWEKIYEKEKANVLNVMINNRKDIEIPDILKIKAISKTNGEEYSIENICFFQKAVILRDKENKIVYGYFEEFDFIKY